MNLFSSYNCSPYGVKAITAYFTVNRTTFFQIQIFFLIFYIFLLVIGQKQELREQGRQTRETERYLSSCFTSHETFLL